MSLILEALKKSEQARPSPSSQFDGLMTSHSSRGGIPRWAIVLMALLGINVLLLLGALWLAPVKPTSDLSVVDARTVSSDHMAESGAPTTPLESASIAPNPTIARGEIRPATEATPVSVPSSNVRAPGASPPTRDELIAQGYSLPMANVALHVFDAQPTARFILLDGQRLVEGDTSRSGLRVNAITADGVVFAHGSSSFKVTIQ